MNRGDVAYSFLLQKMTDFNGFSSIKRNIMLKPCTILGDQLARAQPSPPARREIPSPRINAKKRRRSSSMISQTGATLVKIGALLQKRAASPAKRAGVIKRLAGAADFFSHKPSAKNPPFAEIYMCAMILSPNCEHLISVAPSMRRAKS